MSISEVYGDTQYVPIDEKQFLTMMIAYFASKIDTNAIAMSFYNAFSVPVTIARPLNSSEPCQSSQVMITTSITQFANR